MYFTLVPNLQVGNLNLEACPELVEVLQLPVF